jgi:hypothetical protein
MLAEPLKSISTPRKRLAWSRRTLGSKTLVGELTLKLKKATACWVDAAPIAPGNPV